MSRIGKLPIMIPEGVTLKWKEQILSINGPKGELTVEVKPPAGVTIDDQLRVTRPDDSRTSRAFQGLYRSLIYNAVVGVSRGFERKLETVGVGYKAEVKNNVLLLSLGFASVKEYPIPEGVTIKVDKDIIIVSGTSKQKVGNVAARIRAFRPPEPYKGKGVRYHGEYIKRKAGKAAVGGQL